MNAPLSMMSITSRDNPLLKELRKIAHDNNAYRKTGRIWAEGDHLCSAALLRGWKPSVAVFDEDFLKKSAKSPAMHAQYAQVAIKNVAIPSNLFREISGLESPAGMGFVLELPITTAFDSTLSTVILDRVQDAGNVGSILRSAGAFGFKQIIALKGTAALWSPKVLRAGMGAHFGLHLHESVAVEALSSLKMPLIVTSSHQGDWVQTLHPPSPCAWVFGHEGQGVGAELMAMAHFYARIAQPGGEESLNVAAAAAICLHASHL
jgi:RNA methyltransferase, TrmH family